MDEATTHFFAEETAIERASSRGRKDVGVVSQDEDDGKGVLSRKRRWKEQGPARRATVVGMVAAQLEGKALRRHLFRRKRPRAELKTPVEMVEMMMPVMA